MLRIYNRVLLGVNNPAVVSEKNVQNNRMTIYLFPLKHGLLQIITDINSSKYNKEHFPFDIQAFTGPPPEPWD